MVGPHNIEEASSGCSDSAKDGVSISRNRLLAAGVLAILAGACAVRANGAVETPQQTQGGTAELGLVRNAADSGDWMERAMAAAALGNNRNSEAVSILFGLLLDQDMHVRKTAVDSLAMHKPRDEKDVETLRKIMEEWKAKGYPLGPLERLDKIWMKKAEENRSPVGNLHRMRPKMHAGAEARPQNALPMKIPRRG